MAARFTESLKVRITPAMLEDLEQLAEQIDQRLSDAVRLALENGLKITSALRRNTDEGILVKLETLDDYLAENLKDPEFKATWDALEESDGD